MLEIEYEFQEKDLIHFNELQFMRNEDIKNNIKKNRWLIPAFITVLGSYYYFFYNDIQTTAYVLVIGLLWGLLSPLYILKDLHRQVLKSYSEKEKVNMFGMYKLKIDPSNPKYLFEESPSGKNKMAWDELLRVEYGKRYVYIFITLDTALVIPVEGVKSGNLEQFAEQAEKMIERSGS